jgi:DNA (cytosine-5)-methyltransferase 1
MSDSMRVLSLFSGVGGMDLGLERSGMQVVGMCEIDKHARSVLAHHWPDVPIHDDVTTLETEQWRGRVDLVAGGSPCQDLSVAGRRKGLDGARSGLFWHQCRIADSVAARWVLWENVAGALTSNHGADFAAVLWGITGTYPRVPDGGWRSAGVVVGPKRTAVWRLLDAQYFGVAQRRRRVFVVAGAGAECRPEVLLESEGMCWDSAPSQQQGQGSPISTRGSTHALISFGCRDIEPGTHWRDDDLANTLRTTNPIAVCITQEPDGSLDLGDIHSTLLANAGAGRQPSAWVTDTTEPRATHPMWTVFGQSQYSAYTEGVATLKATDHKQPEQNIVAPTHTASNNPSRSPQSREVTQQIEAVHSATSTVRRLTPVECERLMSWPDDWTRYRDDGKEQADSHRYKQCGNGVVSNVAEWIGRRLMQAHKETTT